MITYKIKKPVTKIHELEIESNITLPYGVVMELQNEVSAGVIAFMHQDLTQETLTILNNYENEMSNVDTTNLEVKGALIDIFIIDDINDNNVEIEGEFL